MKQIKRTQFALNLIAIRKSKGISQRDLSKMTGISCRMIAYYETFSEIPPYEKLNKIASALGINIYELIDNKMSDKKALKFNTRTIKKIKLLEQLPNTEQRKVLDYIKALIIQNNLKNKSKASNE